MVNLVLLKEHTAMSDERPRPRNDAVESSGGLNLPH